MHMYKKNRKKTESGRTFGAYQREKTNKQTNTEMNKNKKYLILVFSAQRIYFDQLMFFSLAKPL